MNDRSTHAARRAGAGGRPKVNRLDPIFQVVQWLYAPSHYAQNLGVNGPIPVATKMTNLDVLANLIARNGFKAEVTGWGFFSGPMGLTQQDGFLLMQLGAYLQGMLDYAKLDTEVVVSVHLQPKLEVYSEKWNREAVAAAEAAAAAPAQVEDDACECDECVPGPRASDPLARDPGEEDGA